MLQDALVTACEAVHRLEKRGRQIIPKSVAYYTIQRLKMGRRSTGAGRTDVMSSGCQLDGNASISSLDEPVHVSEEGNDDVTLGDVLAGKRDDPSQVAVRNPEWSEFMAMLDGRQQHIVTATAQGSANPRPGRLCYLTVALKSRRPAPMVLSRRSVVRQTASMLSMARFPMNPGCGSTMTTELWEPCSR